MPLSSDTSLLESRAAPRLRLSPEAGALPEELERFLKEQVFPVEEAFAQEIRDSTSPLTSKNRNGVRTLRGPGIEEQVGHSRLSNRPVGLMLSFHSRRTAHLQDQRALIPQLPHECPHVGFLGMWFLVPVTALTPELVMTGSPETVFGRG